MWRREMQRQRWWPTGARVRPAGEATATVIGTGIARAAAAHLEVADAHARDDAVQHGELAAGVLGHKRLDRHLARRLEAQRLLELAHVDAVLERKVGDLVRGQLAVFVDVERGEQAARLLLLGHVARHDGGGAWWRWWWQWRWWQWSGGSCGGGSGCVPSSVQNGRCGRVSVSKGYGVETVSRCFELSCFSS